MAQINLKNDGSILTPPSGTIALGISGDNIIMKNDQGVESVVQGGGSLLPVGGTSGQVLSKNSNTNYDATWVDIASSETTNDYLYLSDYSLNVDSNSTGSTIQVYSTKSWTLEDGTFVNAIPNSGSAGTTEVTLIYSINSIADSRTDKISVKSTELGITQNVNINQKSSIKSEYYLSLSDNSLNVTSGTTSVSFGIISTNSWTLSNNGFSTPSDTSGNSGKTEITLTFGTNSSSTRYDRITVTDDITTQSLNLTQQGVSEIIDRQYLELSDPVYVADKNSGTTSFVVNSSSSWTSTHTTNAITYVYPTSGTSGETTVNVDYSNNPYAATRTDRIKITNDVYTKYFSLTQTSDVEGTIDYLNVDPNSDTVTSESGTITFEIDSNISWSIPTISEITITPLTGGPGRIPVEIQYPENISAIIQKRVIQINPVGSSISYRNYTLSQLPPKDNYYIVSQSAIVISSGITSLDIEVNSNVDWEITTGATWISDFTPTSGTGDSTINLTTDQNSGENTRQSTVTISCTNRTDVTPVVVTISQTGSSGSVVSKAPNIRPRSKTVSNNSGTTTFDVESARSWTIEEDFDWLSITPTGATGNDTVTIEYLENKGTNRNAAISIVDVDQNTSTFNLYQESTSRVAVKPDYIETSYLSGSTSVDIASTGEWEAIVDSTYGESNNMIVSVTPSGGTSYTTSIITYTENTNKDFRYGVIDFRLKDNPNVHYDIKIKQGMSGGDNFGNIGGSKIEKEFIQLTGSTGFTTSLDETIDDKLSTSGFATIDYVTGYTEKYATPSDISTALSTSGFATPSDISTALSTSGFATEGYVTSYTEKYATPSDISTALSTSGFATESYVTGLTSNLSNRITEISTNAVQFGTGAPSNYSKSSGTNALYIDTSNGTFYYVEKDGTNWTSISGGLSST